MLMDELQTETFEVFESLVKSGNTEVKELLKKYKNRQDELVEKVSKIVLENLSDENNLVYGSYVAEIQEVIKDNLTELAKEEEEFTKEILDKSYKESYSKTAATFGMAADWSILGQEFIDAAVNNPIDGKSFSDRIWNNCDDLANRIYNDIVDVIKTGKRPNHVARQIKNDYGVTAYQAKRLVNTELARVVNEAQLEIYKNSDVVEKVMWCATLDKNSCEDCAAMDGQTYEIDKAPKLPFHANCRCCLVPVTNGWTPKERADNEDKTKYTDYQTYEEWSKNQ